MNYKYLTVIFLYIMSSCAQEKADITISVEDKMEIRDVLTLNNFNPIATSDDSGQYIALMNISNPAEVAVVDNQGNKVNLFDEQGSGPGELERVLYLGFKNSDTIAVFDDMHMRFTSYTIDSNNYEQYTFEAEEKGYSVVSGILEFCDNRWYSAIDVAGVPASPDTPILAKFDRSFNELELFGEYDPFFENERDVLQRPIMSVDCNSDKIYTTHYKIPYIQVYDLETHELIERVDHEPPSFNLSEQFVPQITDQTEWQDFRIEEQSSSGPVISTDDLLIHTFYNSTANFYESRDLTERDQYIATYDKEDYTYYGEKAIEGLVMGSTHNGKIIELYDQDVNSITLRLLRIEIEV